MFRPRRPYFLLALIVLLASGASSWGQQFQGSFVGTVTDTSGGVVPEVSVIAVEVNKGFTRSVVTLGDGTYAIPLLPPGRYQLSAQKAGFEKTSEGPIELRVDAHVKIDFQLKVGSSTTTVTVEALAPVLDTQTSAVGTTVEEQKVSQLPLNGRHFLELTLFTPGVVPGTQGSENSTRGGAINVNGLRETMNTFLLDGMNNTSMGVGTFVVTPPVDSVQEFRMETSMYEAKFGAQAGAQINVVTKSGTNKFHGTLHEFLRNSALDARNFFDPSVPPFRRNQYGGTVGGPILLPGYDGHDRSFFFLAFEGLRHRRDFFRFGRVPTMAERGGDFSDLLAPDCSTKAVLLNPLALLQGVPQTFTNVSEVIPTGPDPTGQAMVKLFPEPNIPNAGCGAANYGSEIREKAGFDNYVGRVDHRWGSKNSLFFRYNLTLDRETHPSDPYPGFGRVDRNGFTQTGMDWTRTFTPTLINEFKLSYNRWQLRYNNEDQGQMIGQELGIKDSPTVFRQTGIPNLSFSGCCGLGAGTNVPQAGAVNTFELGEALTQVHGNHSLTYGADFRSIERGNFYIDSYIRNQFDFSGLVTGGLGNLTPTDLGLPPTGFTLGNGLADAMLGLPTDWIHGFSTYISGAGTKYDAFVQDSWKVSKNLTLNLGLRYEFNSLVTDKYDHFSSFDFNKGLLMVAGRKDVALMNFDPSSGLYVPAGTENLGAENVNRALYYPDRNNWAPRVGFAWQPFQNSKTVVRGGYGVFYDQTFGDVYLSKVANPPFAEINLGIITAAVPLLMANPQFIGTGYLIQNAFEPGSVAPLFPAISPYELHFKDATIQEWAFDIQRELPGSWLLDLGYVGTRGLHLPRSSDPNQKIPDPTTQTAVRPYPNFDANFGYTESSASSIYHALQMKFEKHYANGLAFIGAYTWSKAIDDVSAFYGTDRTSGTEQNYRNLAGEKGRADFDFRQRLSLAYVYELPFGKKVWRLQNAKLNYFLEDWGLSGIATVQTGAPWTAYISGDISHTEQQDRPNWSGGNPYPAHQTVNQWAYGLTLPDGSPGPFSAPAPYTFGNAGRDILTGPGLGTWDFSLIRKFRLTESKTLEFRAEMFNILNSPNFQTPNSDVASSSFGQIFNTVQPIAGVPSGGPGDPREMQFALKFIW